MDGKPLLKEKDKKKRLPKPSTIRTKCDSLLTPIIKLMYPLCLLCGGETQVAHHHVHKSKSTRLRYHIPNLINLCGKCHVRLHNDESYWGSKVTELKGAAWFKEIEQLKHEQVKADVHYYLDKHKELQATLQTLSN